MAALVSPQDAAVPGLPPEPLGQPVRREEQFLKKAGEVVARSRMKKKKKKKEKKKKKKEKKRTWQWQWQRHWRIRGQRQW